MLSFFESELLISIFIKKDIEKHISNQLADKKILFILKFCKLLINANKIKKCKYPCFETSNLQQKSDFITIIELKLFVYSKSPYVHIIRHNNLLDNWHRMLDPQFHQLSIFHSDLPHPVRF